MEGVVVPSGLLVEPAPGRSFPVAAELVGDSWVGGGRLCTSSPTKEAREQRPP